MHPWKGRLQCLDIEQPNFSKIINRLQYMRIKTSTKPTTAIQIIMFDTVWDGQEIFNGVAR